MNELNGVKKTITTLEISEMLGVKHYKVLEKLEGTKDRKVKGIISVLTDHNFVVSDYFILSAYKDGSGKENKCYLVTKLGCDFIANKFTGEKGGGVIAHSKDGINWTVDKDPKAYSKTVEWENGTITRQGQLERPFILFEDGKPTFIFFATMDGPGEFENGTRSWNMVIPLK